MKNNRPEIEVPNANDPRMQPATSWITWTSTPTPARISTSSPAERERFCHDERERKKCIRNFAAALRFVAENEGNLGGDDTRISAFTNIRNKIENEIKGAAKGRARQSWMILSPILAGFLGDNPSSWPASGPERSMRQMYSTCMDEDAINAAGADPFLEDDVLGRWPLLSGSFEEDDFSWETLSGINNRLEREKAIQKPTLYCPDIG